jgi:hypothetical protein
MADSFVVKILDGVEEANELTHDGPNIILTLFFF